MRFCVSCGHELGVGRFCTNCGHPIGQPIDQPIDQGWRTDTAERPAVAVPPAPRYPLFADEAEEPSAATHRRPGRPWGLWAAAALALVVVAGLGVWLLTGDDSGPDARRPASSQPPASSGPASSPAQDEPGHDPARVTAEASVEVPRTAPPGQDVSGNRVDYAGENLLDGIPETTWRMPGDGTGEELVITLAAETRLRSVGLVNGYAKTARDAEGRELDWYHGNRRVTSVEWVFDDGTTITQDLDDTTAVQSVDVEVTTTTVTLRLVAVSAPGSGRAARDYTAISDVSLVGAG
ncbi:MAG: hypothetical protein HYU55_06305 [Nocardioides sp.]|nr:hypothetical protein [Nocardioides sp.]